MSPREDAKSQRIRLNLGLLTPADRQAREDAETARRLAERKRTQQGHALGLEES